MGSIKKKYMAEANYEWQADCAFGRHWTPGPWLSTLPYLLHGNKRLRIFVYVRQLLPEREKARGLTETEGVKSNRRYWSRAFCKVGRSYAHSAKSFIATCTVLL